MLLMDDRLMSASYSDFLNIVVESSKMMSRVLQNCWNILQEKNTRNQFYKKLDTHKKKI